MDNKLIGMYIWTNILKSEYEMSKFELSNWFDINYKF